MYDYFIGKISESSATAVTLEVGQIGYYLNISLNTYSKIKDQPKRRSSLCICK